MSANRHSDGNESCGSEQRTSTQKEEPRSHPRWIRMWFCMLHIFSSRHG
ncbi:unnamed protein product, partial [Ectocarpus sp. 13 AM-2016]